MKKDETAFVMAILAVMGSVLYIYLCSYNGEYLRGMYLYSRDST